MHSRVSVNLFLLILINCISKNATKIATPVIEDITVNDSKGMHSSTVLVLMC